MKSKTAADPVTPATVKRPAEEKPSDSKKSKKRAKKQTEPETSTKVAPVPPKPAADPVSPATVKRPAEEKPSDSKKSRKKAKKQAEPSAKKQTEPETSTKVAQVPLKSAMKSKPAADSVTPASVKRSAEEKPSDSKKAEKQAEPEPSAKKQTEPETSTKKQPTAEESSKKPFKRIWSANDEIVLLEGLMEYSAKKKSDPGADVNSFLDFIKKDLEFVDVSTLQLQTKIRNLKTKFHNNRVKEKEGKLRNISNPHEQKVYDLSKLFWGKAEEEKASKKASGSGKRGVASEEDAKAKRAMMRFPRKLVGGYADDRIQRMGDEMFEDGTEDGEEWKRMKIEEADAFTRHLEVKTIQSKFVMEKLRSGGN